MFQFPGFASLALCVQAKDTWLTPLMTAGPSTTEYQVGFPIRRSMDQSLFPAPHGLSQGIASFIASCCQGIHQTPLSRLIRSGRRRTAHHCAKPSLPARKFHFSRLRLVRAEDLVSVLDLDSAAVDPFRDHRTHTRVTAGNAFLSLNDVKGGNKSRHGVRLDGQGFDEGLPVKSAAA